MIHSHRRRVNAIASSSAWAWACLLTAGTAAQAAIVPMGDVPGLLDNTYYVGRSFAGSLTIDGGSLLQVPRISVGDQRSGVGTLTVQGAGSWLEMSGQLRDALDIGGWGHGTVQVLAGGNVTHRPDASCALCNVILGNASGSTGQLTVSGANSGFETTRDIYVASTNVQVGVDTNGNTWFWGTQGGTTRAELRVDNGGQLASRMLIVGFDQPNRPAQTGSEVSIGSVLVDGAASFVSLARNTLQSSTAGIALLTVGHSGNGSGTVELRNGGRMQLDGSAAPTASTGINIGGGSDATSAGKLRIDGTGSLVHLQGGMGFVNVGRLPGASGTLEVTAGGLLDGSGVSGLPFMSIGRNGGNGTGLVSGADAVGNASTIRLTGMDVTNGAGAFLHVGRTENGNASQGSLTILAGGQFIVNTSALTLSNAAGQSGFQVGNGDGSVGTLEVRGRNSVTGQRSALRVDGGDGVANWMAVGRDGGNGTLIIADGAELVATSQRVSTPNAGGHLAGDEQTLSIGRRTDSGTSVSTGVVTVTGAGSRLLLQGQTDSAILLARGFNASGTLNLLDGGSASTNGSVAIAQGAGTVGILRMDQGTLTVAGTQNGGAFAGAGAAVSAGRGGGTALLQLDNASVLNISSTAPEARLLLGGAGNTGAAGGSGTFSASGGSQISISGPSARALIGAVGSASVMGLGSLSLSSGSRLDLSGSDAAVRIGSSTYTHGTVLIDASSAMSATALIGVAHEGTQDSGGSGILIVNGTATAPLVAVGSQGLLGGSGVIAGNVLNHGVLAPGNSPGRLTINGALDSNGGRLLLEIEQQANGGWLYDQLVVSDWAGSVIGATKIDFTFVGNSDPQAFLDANLFLFSTFFKQGDGSGGVAEAGAAARQLFDGASFSAQSTAYQISNFSFSVDGGASFAVTAVPEPPALMLMLPALLVVAAAVRRRRP